MTQDLTILGYLGRALSFELSAVQQYLGLARLLNLRGMPQASEKFHREALEEMEHAERIIGRMLALNAAPNASSLRPTNLNGSLPELLTHVAVMEAEIVAFYEQAVDYCRQTENHESRLFFEALLQEEQQHAADMNVWRQQIVSGQPIKNPS